MANHASHAALPYPVRGARYTVEVPYLDADGDPTDPTTPDSEISKDNGAFADCAEEVSVATGARGGAMLTLSGAETDAAGVKLWFGVASGPKATIITLAPRVLAVLYSGTASAGAAGSITLASDVPAITSLLLGCIVKTTGGTGGGGAGGLNNQARVITGYTSGRVASVKPDWETAPDGTTTYEVLLTEAALLRFADLQLWIGTAPLALVSQRPQVDVRAIEGLDPTDQIRDSVVSDATRFAGADVATIKAAVDAEVAQIVTDVGTLLSRLSAARGGYLDNLNIAGLVASQVEAQAIQNNTRVVRVVPMVIERPDSGTQTYRIELLLYDDVGNMETPDSAPTIALVNQAGTDLSARLDSATMALVSTGRYRAIYTAAAADALEQLVWAFSVVEGGATRIYGNTSLIVDTSYVDFTAADRAKLDTLHDTRLTAGRAANLDLLADGIVGLAALEALVDDLESRLTAARALLLDNLDAAVSSRASAAALATVQADTDDIQTRLPAALTAGGRIKGSVEAIADNADAAAALDRSARGIVRGTVAAGGTTTSIPTSSLNPAAAVADQFKGAVVVFDMNTTTTALRGQRTDITANTSGGTLTVTALTTAPVAGDTFVIV